MDPKRRSSKYYITYDSSKGGFVGSIPYNILVDAKTLKILEKGVSPSSITTSFDKYLK